MKKDLNLKKLESITSPVARLAEAFGMIGVKDYTIKVEKDGNDAVIIRVKTNGADEKDFYSNLYTGLKSFTGIKLDCESVVSYFETITEEGGKDSIDKLMAEQMLENIANRNNEGCINCVYLD
jgi:hypothetical protein